MSLMATDLAEVAGAFLHGFVNEPHAALGDLVGQLVVELVEDVLEGWLRHREDKNGRFRRWQELMRENCTLPARAP
jgi:hypothetical protein